MARKRDPEVETLDASLKARTAEGALGELYERLDGGKVRCVACGHRCTILDGHDGICKVRFNRGGTLYVPRGYVAGLQVDPIEKKPYFHAFPGAVALSFGMLGCDFHCGYCFPGETMVVTDRGPISLARAFKSCGRVAPAPGAEIGYPEGLRAVAASGVLRPVRAIFKHRYRGPLAVLRPYYLPPIRCTPEHRVYATLRPEDEPEPIEAGPLTPAHLLAIPREIDPALERRGLRVKSSPRRTRYDDRDALSMILELELEPKLEDELLDACLVADGHRDPSGQVSLTTGSRALAYDLAWRVLRRGHLPSMLETEGQFTVGWYESAGAIERRVVETDRFHLVPLRGLETADFDGDVFNIEVEEEHNYLAGFFLVSNCQNWLTSQALRDATALSPPRDIEPAELVSIAKRQGAPVMVTTYNEPLITSEWAIEVFKAARAAGITCGYVSNGNGTPEVLKYIRPWVDLYKVDLKSFRDAEYRSLGGKLDNVLESIRRLHEMGFWLEIVTLTVPGFNDSPEEQRDIAKFLASVSVDIPWHVTAFHKDYKMTDTDDCTPRQLLRGCEIGKEEGLRYVYAGNIPGHVGDYENTRCWKCSSLLIERWGYRVRSFRVTDQGACPDCGAAIAGYWRAGWKVPEKDGGLPGRHPRALPLAAGPLFPPLRGTTKEGGIAPPS